MQKNFNFFTHGRHSCLRSDGYANADYPKFPLISHFMKKVLQKILLLFAVVTVIAHSTMPHHHHDEIPVAIEQHQGEEEQPAGVTHHDDDKDDHHGIFSFAQLDENFVPVNSQNNSFELPLTYVSAFLFTYLLDDFPVHIKTHFGSYKVFPPPEKYFPSSSHRGPPTV